MTTDNKTLANVQPGGRVRLGDQVLSTSEGARCYVADFFATQLRRHDFGDYILTELAGDFVCALAQHLSAQPSPGGQGGLNYERMFVDACAALAEVSRELGCDPEQGGAEPILAAIAELREALAARQPVGEPDFFMVRDEDESRWRESDEATFDSVKRQRPDDAIALYTAQPPQAVDMGQFRPFVEAQRAEYISHGLTEEDYCVAECDDLLALIDGQAVGK